MAVELTVGPFRRKGVLGLAAAIFAILLCPGDIRRGSETPNPHPLRTGVYAGPGETGVAGAAHFDAVMGVRSTEILDFAADDSWYNVSGPSWLLRPHTGQSARLEYSLPMFPNGRGNSLESCANGSYDGHWRTLASNLVAAKLAKTVVRPGWEFNGTWYRWSAKGKPSAYVGCFRHIVNTMRAVSGGMFSFDWNPNVGPSDMKAEQAYPGDEFVDFVGVDVYDAAPARHADGAAAALQLAEAWNSTLTGDYGLQWWQRFATAHRKALAFPEWGVTHLTDGQGPDDPAFIDDMFDFMTGPGSNVAYEHYFDSGSGQKTHKLTETATFPKSAARLRARLREVSVPVEPS